MRDGESSKRDRDEAEAASAGPAGGASGERAPRRLAPERRRERAVELRKAGFSYRAIAQALGTGPTQARRDVSQGLERLIGEGEGSLRQEKQLELERLDAAIAALFRLVREGDLGAIDRWVRLCETRRKLLGLEGGGADRSREAAAAPKAYVNVEIDRV